MCIRDSVTTLGKIDIKGPDSAEFLNRVYTNAWLKLPIGKARYGVMLREDGIVMDDGTTTRISENHYHMTTTTAQAANVLSHLEYYLQLVWPELNVNVVSSTEQWAGAAIAGPKSKELLISLTNSENPEQLFSNENFPWLSSKEIEINMIPTLAIRVAYTGELGWELHHPVEMQNYLFDKLFWLRVQYRSRPQGRHADVIICLIKIKS